MVAKLDELRARVQYQQQQQVVIAQQNAFEKAKVDLNREIGLACRPADPTDRQHPVCDAGDHPAGRGAADGLRQPAGISLPESETAVRAISKPRRPLRAAAHAYVQRQLRRHWHGWQHLSRDVSGRGHTERADVQRSGNSAAIEMLRTQPPAMPWRSWPTSISRLRRRFATTCSTLPPRSNWWTWPAAMST